MVNLSHSLKKCMYSPFSHQQQYTIDSISVAPQAHSALLKNTEPLKIISQLSVTDSCFLSGLQVQNYVCACDAECMPCMPDLYTEYSTHMTCDLFPILVRSSGPCITTHIYIYIYIYTYIYLAVYLFSQVNDKQVLPILVATGVCIAS